MKKTLACLPLIFILFLIPVSQAQAYCSWREKQTVTLPGHTPLVTYCLSSEKQSAASSCSGSAPTSDSVCCCGAGNAPKTVEQIAQEARQTVAAPKFEIPQFQVPISTIKLSQPTCTANSDGTSLCQVPWLGEYIVGIFNYGLEIIGILAAIVLMAGGLLWLISGGDASKVTQAKELIIGSVTGLIILMSSYIILTQVNPALVNFKPLGIGPIADITPNPDNTSSFSSNCKAQTTGPCAVSNMTAFGTRASQASAICNAESGGNPAIYNKSTKCAGGEYAVWGLFQFNLSANTFVDDQGTVLQCPKAFDKVWTNSKPTCTVVDGALYNQCVKAASNPALSIMNARKLSGGSNWGPWEANAKWCHF